MTMDSDFVSAVSTSAAGDWVETTFDFGEDSSMDVLNYIGGAGKELVTIYNFESGTDRLGFDGNSANLTQNTMDATAAASLIADALGLASDLSVHDIAVLSEATAQLGSAVWTYNGDSYLLSAEMEDLPMEHLITERLFLGLLASLISVSYILI